jgi:hypothetical protein
MWKVRAVSMVPDSKESQRPYFIIGCIVVSAELLRNTQGDFTVFLEKLEQRIPGDEVGLTRFNHFLRHFVGVVGNGCIQADNFTDLGNDVLTFTGRGGELRLTTAEDEYPAGLLPLR